MLRRAVLGWLCALPFPLVFRRPAKDPLNEALAKMQFITPWPPVPVHWETLASLGFDATAFNAALAADDAYNLRCEIVEAMKQFIRTHNNKEPAFVKLPASVRAVFVRERVAHNWPQHPLFLGMTPIDNADEFAIGAC